MRHVGVQYSGPSSPAPTHLSSQGMVTVWNSGLPRCSRRLLTSASSALAAAVSAAPTSST